MKSSDTCRPSSSSEVVTHSAMYLPDIPLPTPPPMANIMVTSRFDLPTRGGCGYRRILSSRSTEFRSPILSRSNLSQNQSFRSPLTTKRFGSENDYGSLPARVQNVRSELEYKSTLALRRTSHDPDCRSSNTTVRIDSLVTPSDNILTSPLSRNRNFENLSRLSDPQNFGISEHDLSALTRECLSSDSVFSPENEEADSISSEIRNRTSESFSNDISPDYQNVFYNDHYISDIDENEEIKEFVCGYNVPERRLSDHSDTKKSPNFKYFSYNTLPSKHYSYPVDARRSYSSNLGSNSSMKSSDYNQYNPQKTLLNSMESINLLGNAVLKSPSRRIVKIAKIR